MVFSLRANIKLILRRVYKHVRRNLCCESMVYLKGHVNNNSNMAWSADNPSLIHAVFLHHNQVGLWCALSAARIIGTLFFSGTINPERYIVKLIVLSLENLNWKFK